MKTKHALFAIFVTVGLIGCRSTPTHMATERDFTGVPTADFTITISGTTGVPFTGTIITDGHPTKTGGTIPATYRVSTHELAASFRKTMANGSIEVHVAVDGQGQGMSSTAKRFGGVRAELVCTPKVQQAHFTTF